MNKKELIEAIQNYACTGLSKVDIETTLNHLAVVVQQELADDGEVTLPGLVKFSVNQRAECKGRNPGTGAEITIPAARVPKIKALKALKDGIY